MNGHRLRIAAVILIALLLRVHGLGETPRWFWDEGANLEYTRNLSLLQMTYFGYRYHHIPHPPLYFLVASFFTKAFGETILALRILSVFASLATMAYIYRILSFSTGVKTGLLGSFLYAISPEAVFWSRMGYANNVLTLFAMACIYHLLVFLKTGSQNHFLAASLITGLSILVEYTAIVFLASFFIVLVCYRKNHVVKGLAIACGPPALFVGSLLAFDDEYFILDLKAYLSIYPLVVPAGVIAAWIFMKKSGAILDYADRHLYFGQIRDTPCELTIYALMIPAALFPVSESMFFKGQPPSFIFLASIIGCFLIGVQTLRNITLAFLVGYALMQTVINRWDHMSIPLHAIAIIGLAHLIQRIRESKINVSPGIRAGIIVVPLALVIAANINAYFLGGLDEAPTEEYEKITDYLNQHTSEDDKVITFTYLSKGLKAKPLLLSHVFIYRGHPFAYWARDYDQAEFTTSHDPKTIKYAVIPQGILEELDNPQNRGLVEELKKWGVEYETRKTRQKIEIRKNPEMP